MKDPNGECVVEGFRERQIVNVCLNDVGIRHIDRGRVSRLHCSTEINTNNISSAPLCDELSVSTFSTTSFEYNFVVKKLRRDRLKPT